MTFIAQVTFKINVELEHGTGETDDKSSPIRGKYSVQFTSTCPPVAHPASSLASEADLLRPLPLLDVLRVLHDPARLAPDPGHPGLEAEGDQAAQTLLGPATAAGLCSCHGLRECASQFAKTLQCIGI